MFLSVRKEALAVFENIVEFVKAITSPAAERPRENELYMFGLKLAMSVWLDDNRESYFARINMEKGSAIQLPPSGLVRYDELSLTVVLLFNPFIIEETPSLAVKLLLVLN